jgi:hypothetical protein
MNNVIVSQAISFVLHLLLQVLLARNLALFDVGYCFPYLAFLLLLPFETGRLQLLALGFGLGFLVDVFYDTGGLHAAASVLTAFVRPYVVEQVVVPNGGYDNGMRPWASVMGWPWFITYAGLLTALHHFSLFLVEAASLQLLGLTLLKALASTLFTLAVVAAFQSIFYRE